MEATLFAVLKKVATTSLREGLKKPFLIYLLLENFSKYYVSEKEYVSIDHESLAVGDITDSSEILAKVIEDADFEELLENEIAALKLKSSSEERQSSLVSSPQLLKAKRDVAAESTKSKAVVEEEKNFEQPKASHIRWSKNTNAKQVIRNLLNSSFVLE